MNRSTASGWNSGKLVPASTTERANMCFSFQLHFRHYTGNLNSTIVRVFTPWKLANATNQGVGFFLGHHGGLALIDWEDLCCAQLRGIEEGEDKTEGHGSTFPGQERLLGQLAMFYQMIWQIIHLSQDLAQDLKHSKFSNGLSIMIFYLVFQRQESKYWQWLRGNSLIPSAHECRRVRAAPLNRSCLGKTQNFNFKKKPQNWNPHVKAQEMANGVLWTPK